MNLAVNNVQNIQRVLNGLSKSLRTKIIRNALKIISKPIIEAAKSKVWSHQRTGRIYRSLGQKAAKRNGSDLIILGARKTGKYKGSYAHLLENGTKNRSYITKKGVRHRTGFVRGINFWSTSVEEGSVKSENEFNTYLVQSLENEVNRLYRKANK